MSDTLIHLHRGEVDLQDLPGLGVSRKSMPRAVLQRNERMLTMFAADLIGWLMENLRDSLLSR
jgi:hypothetical protein